VNTSNQHPEQQARGRIDGMPSDAGWTIQSKGEMNVFAAPGVAVRKLPISVGPADYGLFADGIAVGVIEAKRAEEGVRLTAREAQTHAYRTSPIKLLANDVPLRFGYESTGELTRFAVYAATPSRVRARFSPSPGPKR
jgi:type I restriction enzyme, R subunit